ncbi:poly(R)-hydroxyalkanoic acid synthase subunit PhaE [Luteimonas huabeiensis]|uniref:poly(R)-hydroxyalkanoic acid synthase subunit PhaE n=1 Tax=Luteimonas huabeiensis TaxID=1244513 RepID=UPI000463176D|nr:poly(R)-hydroxyalkanoic acid synthase subunit PhaE [Luteimonas huabeiensis]
MADDPPQEAFAAATADFDALARRFWGAWRDALQQAAPAGPPFAASGGGAPGFGPAGIGLAAAGFARPGDGAPDPFAWWAPFARGGGGQADEAVARFDAHARRWYAQLQQIAAQFAGRESSAADVVEAWKRLLTADGANPFASLLSQMQQGAGSRGPDAWWQQAAPYLAALRGEARSWLQVPAFGPAREQQARWQALGVAQLQLQEKLEAYNALMARALQDAFVRFERKLAEREQPGLQIESPRALFDLWIDAAEDAYAAVALAPEFRSVYAGLVDAQMRLRQGVQREVEAVCALFDMPTRSELDGAHRKIVELERQVRRLLDAAQATSRAAGAATAAPVEPRPSPRGAARGKRAAAPAASRAAAPARGGQRALFSAAEAMPAAPAPLKKRKR